MEGMGGAATLWRGVLAGAIVAAAACGGSGDPSKLEGGLVDPIDDGPGGQQEDMAGVGSDARYDDKTALAWLTRECGNCHGVDPATGKKAEYHSAWPLPPEGITRRFLEVNELTSNAYQTLRHAALKLDGATPARMPPQEADDAKRGQLRSMIDWFQRSVPYAVIDADARYGNDSPASEKRLVEFSCKKPSTLRAFISRVTFGAFERPPTTAELGEFTDAELSAPVTPQQRELVVAKLDGVWKKELVEGGLKKLATVIGGGPGIQAQGPVTAQVASDLRSELYQSFVAHYETAEYADYFASNSVMVTANTAPLYGCEAGEGWRECAMQAPRGGFFTTLGFLNSKPQSFLLENNNHGRVASLYFTLYGEALLAATSGPTGEGVPALPSCLESTDTRHFQGAPRGSAAVPEFGKVCQSCHVSRHMAAGSVLFRPFSTTGSIYNPDTLGDEDTPDALLVAGATSNMWTLRSGDAAQPVSKSFLRSLITTPATPCVQTGKPANPFVTVSSVSELASQLMTNRSSFARGFMRHAQRAFANLPSITLEMGLRSLTAFDAGKTKLPDLVKTYFSTDSFACEAER
jgi:hypothetical protein